MTGAIPQAPQKSHLEKLRKYEVVDFYGKKDDDPSIVELWLKRTTRVLHQFHCTPYQSLEYAVSLL